MSIPKTYEGYIKDKLSGDMQKNALDFAAFLRANDFSTEWNGEHEGWNITYQSKNIIFSTVSGDENVFAIVFDSCDFGDGDPVDNDLKEFAWKHAAICPTGCGGSKICKMSKRGMIFGKEYKNICIAPLECFNLDADELEKVQKLMLMLK